jgi:hypothetical protein
VITKGTCCRCGKTGTLPLAEIVTALEVAATHPGERCAVICSAAVSHLRCHAETCVSGGRSETKAKEMP